MGRPCQGQMFEVEVPFFYLVSQSQGLVVVITISIYFERLCQDKLAIYGLLPLFTSMSRSDGWVTISIYLMKLC